MVLCRRERPPKLAPALHVQISYFTLGLREGVLNFHNLLRQRNKDHSETGTSIGIDADRGSWIPHHRTNQAGLLGSRGDAGWAAGVVTGPLNQLTALADTTRRRMADRPIPASLRLDLRYCVAV